MVLPVEAEAIRESRGGMLGSQEPGAEGACAMLSPDGACRIYDDRPYVCRAQGLPLRWIEEVDGEPGWMEKRDICSLNHPAGTPLELLPPEACWTIGPFEERLARLQAACGSRDTRRIPLRGLFGRAGSPGREDLFAGGGLE